MHQYSLSVNSDELSDGLEDENSSINKVKETNKFANKLLQDKGKPKPHDIYSFLGVRCRTMRQRSITVTPFRSKNKLGNKVNDVTGSNTNGVTKREDNTLLFVKDNSNVFKQSSFTKRVEFVEHPETLQLDMSQRKIKTRKVTSTLKKKDYS